MRAVEMSHLTPWIDEVCGWRVLDVGCGHGLYSLGFARRDADLLGCDLSASDLSAAHETAGGMGLDSRTAFAMADAAALPVPAKAFDLIVCNCVLEHVLDDHGALTAMGHALRPGGVLYLTVDNAEHDLVLGMLERLPPRAKALLLRPEVAKAPSVFQGLDDYLAGRYHVRRRYYRQDLQAELEDLGLEVMHQRTYLSRLGAAHFEAFHTLRGLDPQKGLGRLAYMVSSLLLYPLVALIDGPQQPRGYGLVFVSRKPHAPKSSTGTRTTAHADTAENSHA
jgi:SAM-dependent methyltransferase